MEQSLKQVLGDEVHFKAEHVALQLLCCVFLQHLLPFVELVWLERLSLPLAAGHYSNWTITQGEKVDENLFGALCQACDFFLQQTVLYCLSPDKARLSNIVSLNSA